MTVTPTHCLFFIHGMLCDAKDWKFQIDFFSKKYRVVAPDWSRAGPPWDIPSLAKHLASSLLGSEKIIIVGHSVAARIAVELCLLLGKKVDGCILLDTGYQSTSPPTCAWAEEEKRLIAELGYKNWLHKFFDTKFGPTTPEHIRNLVMLKAQKVNEEVGIALYLNTIVYDYYALEKALRLLEVPVLILQSSRNDWLSLARATLPNAQIQLIENCGHWIMLEQPDLCNELIDDFLKKLKLRWH